MARFNVLGSPILLLRPIKRFSRLRQKFDSGHKIIVDGFVAFGDSPGLGTRLWEALDKKVPIIGIAKSRFRCAAPVEVIRGSSKRPLYVTAPGIEPSAAAESIRRMHRPNRIPSLLKRVDRLTRSLVAKVQAKDGSTAPRTSLK